MSKKLRTLKEVLESQGQLNERFENLKTKIESEGLDKLTEEERAEVEGYQQNYETLIKEERMARSTSVFSQSQLRQMANATPGENNGDLTKKDVLDLSKASLGNALRNMAAGKKLEGREAALNEIGQRQAQEQGIEYDPETAFVMPMEVGTLTRNITEEGEQRGQTVTGQTTNAGDQGGVYVPTEIAPFIAALWKKTFLSTVGATRFTNLRGNQSFPVQTSRPNIGELTEIEETSDGEVLWSQLAMNPKRRGASIPISRLLMIQGSIDTQKFVQDQLAVAMAGKLEADAMVQLLSLASPQLIALGTNGAALDWSKVVALETAVANNDAEGMYYLINTVTRGHLKTTKKDAGSGLFLMEGTELNGYPTAVSNYAPSNLVKGSSGAVCSAAFFGNFKDLYIGMWGGLVFDIDRKAKKDLSEFVVNGYWDVKVARKESFASYKDILTS